MLVRRTNKNPRAWREVTPAPPLFPAATSVRLSGCMTSEFVTAVLAQPRRCLQHVELSNFLTWSPISKSPSNIKHISYLEEWAYENPTGATDQRGSYFRPLIGALDPLIDHCNLTSLCLRTLENNAAGSSPIDSRYHRLYKL